MKRKSRNNTVFSIVIIVAILLLAVAVTASLTAGFKNFNPYGWLENYDRIEKEQEINGFEVCTDFELDFEKLIKGIKAVENDEKTEKTYAVLSTDNEAVYINVIETEVEDEAQYKLVVNGQTVCTSQDGFNDTAIEAIKSFDTCKVVSIENAGRLAHYIGATFTAVEAE